MADSSYKGDLITKINEIFGFNLKKVGLETIDPDNRQDGVDYDFGQYKLNQLYKPLVTIFVNEFAKFLDSNDKSESDQILSLFLDFYKLYYFQGDFGYFKSKYSSFKYKIPYGMDYSGNDTEFWRASKDCYYVKTSDVVNEIDFQVPTENLTTRDVRIQFFKRTRQDSEGKATPLDIEIERIEGEETEELLGYNIIIYNFDEDKATKPAKEKAILDKMQGFGIQTTPGLKSTLSDFLAKRGRDYFIHKRLKDFLKGELERYLFQILKLDTQGKIDILSVQNKIEEIKEKYKGDDEYIDFQIAKIYNENSTEVKPTIYQNAYIWILNFINILGDLEDFKAKLWNKKRKIVKQEYCISLGKIKEYENLIPRKESMLKYIFDNKKQIQEWKDLGMSNNPTIEDDSLVVDTSNFDGEERENLINLINEDRIIGKLYNSDNYQALSYMKEDNAGKIDCIYIDPPYNTGTDGFVYKDGYNESSWLTMIESRLIKAKETLSDNGVMFISIDDNEISNLKEVCNNVFGKENTDIMIWRKSGVGRDGKMKNTTTFRKDHEYIIVCFKNNQVLNKIVEKPNFVNEYPNPDNDPRGEYKAGSISRKEEASNPNHKNYYTVTAPGGRTFTRQFDMSQEEFNRLNSDYLVNPQGKKVSRIYRGKDDNSCPSLKIFINEDRAITPYSILLEKGTTTEGTKELSNIIGRDMSEIRPKPSYLIQTLSQLGTSKTSTVFDFFAGSGTTGQAVFDLNKKDQGSRKFIEVELGEYFKPITLTRTKKTMYSQNWEDGKSLDNNGTQGIVEYTKLNQYEDRFSPNGYLTKLEDEISQLKDFEVQENTKISQILSPLNELKQRIYNIDDELTNEELLSVYND